MNLFKLIFSIIGIFVVSSCASNITDTEKSTSNASPIVDSSGCNCLTYSCKCCEDVNIGVSKGTVCADFAYLPNDYGISFVITYNNYTVINETISARNPPPMCAGIPELEKVGAEICLRLSDLAFQKGQFHGCVSLQIAVYHVIHKDIEFGCFYIPPNKTHKIFSFKIMTDSKIKNHNDNEIDYKSMKDLPTVQMI